MILFKDHYFWNTGREKKKNWHTNGLKIIELKKKAIFIALTLFKRIQKITSKLS